MNSIVKKLKTIVGADWVRLDSLSRYYYSTDVMTHFSLLGPTATAVEPPRDVRDRGLHRCDVLRQQILVGDRDGEFLLDEQDHR